MHLPREAYPSGFAEYLQPLPDARLRFLKKCRQSKNASVTASLFSFCSSGVDQQQQSWQNTRRSR